MARRSLMMRSLVGAIALAITPAVCTAGSLDDARAVGLGPETLAVAGVSGSGAAAILARVDAAEPLRVRLGQDRAALDAALVAVAAAREQVASGARSSSEENALRLAEATLVDARAAIEQTRDLLFATAIASIDGERAALVSRARSNLARNAPAHYRVAELTTEEWDLLERACREARMREARVARGGSPAPLPQEYVQIIAEVEGQSAVQQAEAHYLAHCDEVALEI